jgi:hypothetical protein
VVGEDVLEYYKGVRLRCPLLAAGSALWSEGIPHIYILAIGHGRTKRIEKSATVGECFNPADNILGAMAVPCTSAMLAVYGVYVGGYNV